MVPALFGILGFAAIAGLAKLAPQPMGGVVLWSILAVQQAWMGLVVWRRMALPYATLAQLAGSLASVGLVFAATRGRSFLTLPGWWAVGVYGLLAASLILTRMESVVHKDAWRAWDQNMRGSSLMDVLLLRHIPDLRHDQARIPGS